MLTKEQEKWIQHLSDTSRVEIMSYNQKSENIFLKIKKEIKKFLGNIEIFHCGSTALKILGQEEIDLYIPVVEKEFNNYLAKLVNHFGKPSSAYLLKRVRFVRYLENIKIEIFLINRGTNDWKNIVFFESYLKRNKKSLEEYKKIKEESNGLFVREYYRKKIEFINKILKKRQKNNF